MVPHLSEVRVRCRKAVGSIHLVPVKRKRCVTTKADDSREEVCPPWLSCGSWSAGRHPTSREAWEPQSGQLPEVPSIGTRKGGRAHGTSARFRPPKASGPNRALCAIRKGCTRPEESRPKPQGSWTAAPGCFEETGPLVSPPPRFAAKTRQVRTYSPPPAPETDSEGCERQSWWPVEFAP